MKQPCKGCEDVDIPGSATLFELQANRAFPSLLPDCPGLVCYSRLIVKKPWRKYVNLVNAVKAIDSHKKMAYFHLIIEL